MSAPTIAPPAASILLREATPYDNRSLLELDAACRTGMRGEWSIRHEPDFFAIFRAAGVRARVGLAESDDGSIVGVVTIVEQPSASDDVPLTAWYVSGWQVHPWYRGRGIGSALACWVLDRYLDVADTTHAAAIAAAPLARRLRGLMSRLTPSLSLAPSRALRSYCLHTAHWRSLMGTRGWQVRPAEQSDVGAMADLWTRAARTRCLAPALGAAEIERWRSRVMTAPPANYWVACTPAGALRGFIGLWDQRAVKQFRLSRATVADRALDALGATTEHRQVGYVLPCLAAMHACVSPDVRSPLTVYRALLARSARAASSAGYRRIFVVADAADPLADACGEWTRSARPYSACIVRATDPLGLTPADDRPLHIDAALA